MARKRRIGTKRHYSKGSSFTSELMPLGIATITEPMVDSLISSFLGGLNTSLPLGGMQIDDVAKVGLAMTLGKKGGTMGKVLRYYGIFGMRNIIQQLTTGMLLKPVASTSSQTSF